MLPITVIDDFKMSEPKLQCPLPFQYDQIVMAHGGGGRLMQQLLDSMIQPVFSNPLLDQKHDSAVFNMGDQKIAFTTDSYVVDPLFFAGGDIGKLAVCGTLNDLAMSGAKPLYITCSLIIEEGFAIQDLQRIVRSMQNTAQESGVLIVTGDTKVVERGKGDGLYINTAGVGTIETGVSVHPSKIHEKDAVIINSDLGRHGIAIMQEREGFDFGTKIESDCVVLSDLVQNLISSGIEIHCMRDLTRGGLASVLIEIADSAKCHIEISETKIPVRENVKSACEILGFDPLYIANEGCFALFVPQSQVNDALSCLKQHDTGKQARQIGRVKTKSEQGMVSLKTALGISRVLDLYSGEQLPRIC